MAQLKDLIVTGASKFINDVITNKIQITKLAIPTSSGGNTYGAGTSGQVIKTNGTSIYWASLGAAAAKAVDSSISVGSTSTNLPTSAAVASFINNLKGTANGVAELDNNGKVPSSQLPSYVDDVIEGYAVIEVDFDGDTPIIYVTFYSDPEHEHIIQGESGKIYIDITTGKTYRYTGTNNYAEISASLALGETSSTAYRGDRGKTAYDHSQLTSGNPHNVSKSDIGLGNVDNVQQYSASNPPPYPVTSVNGSTGAVTFTIPTKVSDLTNDSGFITGMYIGSYGSSTYAEVLAAYQAKKIVYCRASSNSDPSSGEQKRLAFLAYVNYDTTPTEFEFQYYRSVATHTDAQQGDQVFVYKLNSSTGWSVTTREASSKVAANNGLTTSYASGTITISHANTAITAQSTQAVYPIAIDAYGHITGYGSAVTIPNIPTVGSSDNGKVLMVVNGVWAASDLPIYDGAVIPTANGVEF